MAMEVMTRLEELNIVSIIYAVTLFLQINVFLLTICFTHDDRHHYHVVIYIRPHPFIHLSPSDRPIIVSGIVSVPIFAASVNIGISRYFIHNRYRDISKKPHRSGTTITHSQV